jgi:hypothetical protein
MRFSFVCLQLPLESVLGVSEAKFRDRICHWLKYICRKNRCGQTASYNLTEHVSKMTKASQQLELIDVSLAKYLVML